MDNLNLWQSIYYRVRNWWKERHQATHLRRTGSFSAETSLRLLGIHLDQASNEHPRWPREC